MADILDISGCQEPWHQGSKVHSIQLVRSISLYLQRIVRILGKKERKKERNISFL